MSQYNAAERIIKRQSRNYLQVMERRFGLFIKVIRPIQDKSTQVYGSAAGTSERNEELKEIRGFITDNPYFPSDLTFSSDIEGGFLFTTDEEIKSNDIIEAKANDDKVRRFKVINKETVGLASDIFPRFVLSALGD